MEIQRGNNDRASGEGSRNSRPIATRVLGVSLVLAVVALPVLYSDGFDQWVETPLENTYIASVGWGMGTGLHHLVLAMGTLYSPGGPNQTRLDHSSPMTVTFDHGGVLAVDLTNGYVNPGDLLPDLSGYCCYSDDGFVVHNGTIFYTGTAPGGVLEFIEIDPADNVTTTRIDPTSTNDFTAETEATLTGLLTLTSSTDSNQTVIYGTTFTDTHDWNLLTWRTSDDVFQNRHPGLTVNPVLGDGFLLYALGTDANLLKFDPDNGNTIWEVFDIVDLGPPPDSVFNYFQVVEDDGNVALRVPRNNDTVIVFIDDAGGSGPPVEVQYHTIAGSPPGDRQAFQLNNRIVTSVHPASAGTGTEIRHVYFSPDPTVPPNVITWEDNTVTGAWHNTAPGYAVFLTDPGNPDSAVVYDIKPNRMFIVQGDPDADVVRYGTVEVPISFDGFESDSLKFWSISSP